VILCAFLAASRMYCIDLVVIVCFMKSENICDDDDVSALARTKSVVFCLHRLLVISVIRDADADGSSSPFIPIVG